MKAVAEYYSDSDATLLWIDDNGLNSRAKSVMEEIGKADDYGLRASDYGLPKLDSFESPNATAALADAEIKLDVAMLRYARDARGGRFDWTKINPKIDPTLALPDPLQVLESWPSARILPSTRAASNRTSLSSKPCARR